MVLRGKSSLMPSICHAFWAEDCKYEATSVFVFESVINIILVIHYLAFIMGLIASILKHACRIASAPGGHVVDGRSKLSSAITATTLIRMVYGLVRRIQIRPILQVRATNF